MVNAIHGVKPIDITRGILPQETPTVMAARFSRARKSRGYFLAGNASYSQFGNATISNESSGLGTVIVKKQAAWTVGSEFRFLGRAANDDAARVLNSFVKKNGGLRLLRTLVVNGLLDGTAYWHPYVRTTDMLGRPLPPERHNIGVQRIPFNHCIPVWDTQQPGVMSACLIQLPITIQPAGRSAPVQALFSRVYTPELITNYIDYEKVSEMPNALGFVPIVGAGFNNEEAVSPMGESVIYPVIPEFERLNELTASRDAILHYHGEPTTLIFGAVLDTAEQSSRSLWSGLPKDGKAQMLALDSGTLAPIQEVIKGQVGRILTMMRIPRIALADTDMHVSGLSAQAMELLFSPLLEVSREHREILEEAIQRLVAMTVAHFSVYLGYAAVEQLDWDVALSFDSLLPKDRPAEFELDQKKKLTGVLSTNELIRRHSGITDDARLRRELAADQVAELVLVREKQRALNDQAVDPLAATLASPFLDYSVDIKNLQPTK